MNSSAWRAFAALAVLATWLDMSASPFNVRAEEAASDVTVEAGETPAPSPADGEAPAATDGEAPAATDGEGGEGEADAGEKGQAFVDSAKELQEKLGQLKALLDAKGVDADPDLKARLSGLETQLKGLGLDSILGGGEVGSNKDLTEFLSGCVAMSMRRAGIQRPSTVGSLRKLAENKLPPAEAAKQELWRMVGVCVGDFTEDEFADFKSGKLKILPKSYVDAAKKPEAEKKVMEIEAQVWEELRVIAAGLVKELVGEGGGEKPPFNFGLLALIPMGIMIGLMVKLFLDMKNREQDKKDAKAKKDSKKGK